MALRDLKNTPRSALELVDESVLDPQQLDFEHQRRLRGDDGRMTADA